jgi:iron complex outermembrane receptor protein
MKPSVIGAVGLLALTQISLQPARAQSADTTNAARDASKRDILEEIVVTAEKRSSTIQDTPISISAVSGAQLQQEGIVDITGVLHDVPGISARTSGPGQTELEMRGLSSSGGSSPTVGFYLNDYPLTPPAAALVGKVVIDPDLFDLNRVEVLRGPQGTLYGSGSMGGTVKLVTNQPSLKQMEATVEAFGSSQAGGGFNRGGSLMFSAPLVSDVLAMRVVLTDKTNAGFIDRVVLSPFPVPTGPGPCGPGWPGCVRGDVVGTPPAQVIPRANGERLQGGRVEFLAKPSEALTIDAMAMYQKISLDGYSEYDAPPGTEPRIAHYQPFNLGEPFSDIFRLYGLTLTYELGFAQLTSATAYYSRTESQNQDDSEALYSVQGLFGVAQPQFFQIPFNETDTTEQYSEELRLASSGGGRLQWIAGAFFAHFKSVFEEYNASVPFVAYVAGSTAGNPLGLIYQAHNPYHIKQEAVFGETTYALTDALKLTTGLRWYKFDSDADEETAGLATGSGTAAQTLNSFSTSNTGLNPKATLSYEHEHDLTVYATIARGFRPGGINQQIPASLCTLTTETYGPDSIWNFEVGEKAKLLDNRLVVNADVYYIKWKQVQQVVNQNCGYPLTENAGDAASYGPELEITARVTPELVITLAGAYTHAALTSVSPFLAQNTAINSGTPILNVPKYTESASVTYTRPLSEQTQLVARVSNSYVGPSTDIAYTYETLSPYNLVAARVGLVTDRWSAFLFGDNLTNKHAELSVNTSSFAWQAPSLVRTATNRPRTIGLDVVFHF